ncbi:ATP11-domain-containing protein [Sporormia fimetaria CBS 119925]|uniref:ATP11-domain-containing protein n=1 Tax=Sporormia fimetaria CBS 119925 TaxID=1340428 RepID=A0A6A6VKC7_9PLEO|nr:ATP11-domain-containing protein [Sporormia fimetaria CBS 119925]
MTSCLRAPTIRHLVRRSAAHAAPYQRRWARVHDARFLTTHGVQEHVMAKYKEKLESKAKQQGLKDVSELKEAYKEKIETLRKQAAVPGATAPLTPPPTPPSSAPSSPSATSWQAPPPPPAAKPSPVKTEAPPGVKTLSSFLILDKIMSLPKTDIESVWHQLHESNPHSLHFGLPASTFNLLMETAKKHPSFVVPLPRQVEPEDPSAPAAAKTAAELHYLQFAHPHEHTTTLLFTSLAEFKLRGEFASPHTTITFHSELADSHDLVLGQGQVMENRGVSVDDARWLIMCMQKFYIVTEEGKGRAELLDMFTRGDPGFNVNRLIDEAEKIL